MSKAVPLKPGMVIDVGVWQSVSLHPSVDTRRIVLTVEPKSGQLCRIRIQSDEEVRISPPKRLDRG